MATAAVPAIPTVSVEAVTVYFGGFRALDGVTLAVQPGERHAIIGPNGAGKTTLLRVISGALTPTAGRVTLFGDEITRMSEHARASRGIARTYQITNLFAHLTALDNLHLAVHGLASSKWAMFRTPVSYGAAYRRAVGQLERVGLGHRADDVVATLSHGEQRQLEIAVALVSRPRVLLLDEPAAGLAPGEREAMARLLRDLSRDTSVLIIEHDLTLTMSLADRITVLHHGQVVAVGSPDEVQNDDEVRRIYLGRARTHHG